MNSYKGLVNFNNKSADISLNVITLPCHSETNTNCTQIDSSSSANYSKFQSKLSPTADIILGCYILIICILSVVLNILVILTVMRRRRGVTPLEIYVINMAVVDLCPTVLAYPSTTVSAFSHGWVLGDMGCVLSGFSVYFFAIAGITNLTAMSIMRYIVTCRHKSETVNRRFVMLTLILVYGNALLWCLTPMVGWGRYGPEQSGISCALEWRHLPLSYVITTFVVLFALPVIIMTFCYCCIIREVYITQKGTQMIRKRMDIYMIKMTIMMTLCFLVAWTPYAVVAFLATKPWSQDIPLTLSVAAAFMAKSSSFYNPIVYVFTVKRFRLEMAQTLCCFVTNDTNATVATHFTLNHIKPGFNNQKESDSLLSTEQRSRSGLRDSQASNDQQEKGPLVITEVEEPGDIEQNKTLFEMPYMGPYVSGTLSNGPSKNGTKNNPAEKKETRVMFLGVEGD